MGALREVDGVQLPLCGEEYIGQWMRACPKDQLGDLRQFLTTPDAATAPRPRFRGSTYLSIPIRVSIFVTITRRYCDHHPSISCALTSHFICSLNAIAMVPLWQGRDSTVPSRQGFEASGHHGLASDPDPTPLPASAPAPSPSPASLPIPPLTVMYDVALMS